MQHYPITDDQVDEFKRAVLEHVLSLDEGEWFSYRYFDALMGDRWVNSEVANPDVGREELVTQSLMSCTVPAPIVFAIRGEWLSIAELAQQPIKFNSRAGLYVWANSPDASLTLQVWLSFPALPKGW